MTKKRGVLFKQNSAKPVIDGFIKHFLFIVLISLTFSCAQKQIHYTQEIPPVEPGIQNKYSGKRDTIVQQAIKNIGRPYRWGGISPKTGFDCSGLTTYTHQKVDIPIPRTAREQFNRGKTVSKRHIQAADLVFFKNPRKKSSIHVGIYIGDGTFVHAPGQGRKVTYGDLTNPYFKKHYIGSRSYL